MAEAYELADSRARIDGLERLIDEIGSQRDKLEVERDDWKAADRRESEASRVLLRGAQDSTRILTATIEPQTGMESREMTRTPEVQRLAVNAVGVGVWISTRPHGLRGECIPLERQQCSCKRR